MSSASDCSELLEELEGDHESTTGDHSSGYQDETFLKTQQKRERNIRGPPSPLEPRVGREEHDAGEGGSGEDVEGVVVAADDCAERDGDREDEKEETCGQREAQQNERHGEGRG